MQIFWLFCLNILITYRFYLAPDDMTAGLSSAPVRYNMAAGLLYANIGCGL